jgi:hypothetical protein
MTYFLVAPRTMEAFANTLASQMASLLRDQNPILVVKAENLNCGSVKPGPPNRHRGRPRRAIFSDYPVPNSRAWRGVGKQHRGSNADSTAHYEPLTASRWAYQVAD